MASPARASILGVQPGPGLRGEARVPGSKSIAQRALMAAALARGTTRFGQLPRGDDVLAAASLAALLARPEPARVPGAAIALHAGESGTLARLALAVLGTGAGGPGPFELSVAGTLRRRRSQPLVNALREAGARITSDQPGGGWPLSIVPAAQAPGSIRLRMPVSSQEASGLCLALAGLGDERALHIEGRLPSRPYLDLTLAVLARFGARTSARWSDAGGELHVCGPLIAPPASFAVETDASLAAVALAAGIASGGRVTAAGVGASSAQGDVRATELFRALGFAAAREGELSVGGDGRPFEPAAAPGELELDLAEVPDLAPLLVALAAALRPGRAAFTGLETLNRKESPRLSGLARGLAALGIEVELGPGRLALLRPPVLPAGPVELDCAGDHRMAFAWSLIGLAREGVTLRGAECVTKSWPGFFEELERLGARLHRDG